MGDAIPYVKNSTHVIDIEVNIIVLNLLFNYSSDFFRLHFHIYPFTPI